MFRLPRYQRKLRKRRILVRCGTRRTKNYLRYRGQRSDVVLLVKGTKFQAHRVVLLELSPYFSALLSRWSKPLQFMYTIPGMTPNVMKPILQYAYSKQIRITQSNVQDLLVAADYLLVGDIVKRCTQFMEKHLNQQNCMDIWRFANKLSLSHLSERALLLSEVKPLTHAGDPPLTRSTKRRQKPYTRPTGVEA